MRLPTHCSSIAVNPAHHHHHHQEEVAAIEQQILKHAASPLQNSSSIPVLVGLLQKLRPLIRLHKHVYILTDTRIGKAVHALTKHASPPIASLAKALISAWKKLLHHSHSSSKVSSKVSSYEEKMKLTKRKLAAGYERELSAKRDRTICLLQPEELPPQPQSGHHQLTKWRAKPNILHRMRISALSSSSSNEKKKLFQQQHKGMEVKRSLQQQQLHSLESGNYKIIRKSMFKFVIKLRAQHSISR